MQRRGAFILYYDGESGRGTEEEVEHGGRRAQRFALQNLTFHISWRRLRCKGSCKHHVHPENCTLEDMKVCSELARKVLPPFPLYYD
jgi:hypothetical protein